MIETFDWLKPSLLWQVDGLDFRQLGFFRPQLFEFRSDSFMEEFLAAAASPQLDALQPFMTSAPAPNQPQKLFLPVHGCFYLVCASLCCRLPGFPDRTVQLTEGETVYFVIRRLTDQGEAGWVVTESHQNWQPLNGQVRQVLVNEERHPFSTIVGGNGRDLMVGYLPTTSKETYNVPAADLAVPGQTNDTRLQELGSRFITPLVDGVINGITDAEIALTVSVYLLVDLWDFLQSTLPDITEALLALPENPSPTFSGDKAQAKVDLINYLKSQILPGSATLASALSKVGSSYEALNQPGGGDLAQLGFNQTYNLSQPQSLTEEEMEDLMEALEADLQILQTRVDQALPDDLPPVELPKFDSQPATQYILRCVYERSLCDPPVHIVSQPSAPFTFSPFFDPDAPSRPVKIPLPTDVSIAGLRKFKKNVTFLMSDAMRQKVEIITGKEKSLIQDDPPELNAPDGQSFAFICSFSFQIIFIVAFFLLLIFVIIFDFFFRWIVFFKICLPIPKDWLPE